MSSLMNPCLGSLSPDCLAYAPKPGPNNTMQVFLAGGSIDYKDEGNSGHKDEQGNDDQGQLQGSEGNLSTFDGEWKEMPMFAMAAPWYFNPKGLNGPYPPNRGPLPPKWKVTPGPNSPADEEEWIWEEAAEMLKTLSEHLHLLEDFYISIPVMVNPCPMGYPDVSRRGGGCTTMY